MNLLKFWMKNAKPNDGGVLVLGEVQARRVSRFGAMERWRKYPNGAVTVGLNKLLDVGFRNQTQISAWYMSLIDESGFSALSASDTSASHAGWVELQDYSGNRQAYSPGAASGGSITISSAIAFTMTDDVDVRGMLLASSNTKGSAVDVLWATAVESAARSIANGDQYQVNYTITLTPTS